MVCYSNGGLKTGPKKPVYGPKCPVISLIMIILDEHMVAFQCSCKIFMNGTRHDSFKFERAELRTRLMTSKLEVQVYCGGNIDSALL